MILHFLLRKYKKSKVAKTLIKMIVNRGATITTQALESMASSSDEEPWNGVSVTLFKEKEIWFILDLKANTYTVKTQFWKSHHCKENLYFLNIIFGIFLFWYMTSTILNSREAQLVILQSGGLLQIFAHICIYWRALSYLRSATGPISSWGQTSSVTPYTLQYLFICFFLTLKKIILAERDLM